MMSLAMLDYRKTRLGMIRLNSRSYLRKVAIQITRTPSDSQGKLELSQAATFVLQSRPLIDLRGNKDV
jgi:hypothetical protein